MPLSELTRRLLALLSIYLHVLVVCIGVSLCIVSQSAAGPLPGAAEAGRAGLNASSGRPSRAERGREGLAWAFGRLGNARAAGPEIARVNFEAAAKF